MQKYVEQIDRTPGKSCKDVWCTYPTDQNYREMVYGISRRFRRDRKRPRTNTRTENVLFYLYSKLDFENFIQQSQKEIAEGLGMHKEQVSRAMKILTSKQIVLEGPKVGRSKCYRLNPNYGWKGKVKTLQEARREQLQVIQGGKAKD